MTYFFFNTLIHLTRPSTVRVRTVSRCVSFALWRHLLVLLMLWRYDFNCRYSAKISWTQSCEMTITIVDSGRLPSLPRINIQGIILPQFTKYKHCSLILESLWFHHFSSWPRVVSTFWTWFDFWCQRIWLLCNRQLLPDWHL